MNAENVKICIIEDNERILEVMSFILNQQNYNVIGSNDGGKGLNSVIDNKPDLVILDLGLPDISGDQVFKSIKANPEISNIPIVIVSAHKGEEDIVEGLNMGVDDYITKPFNYNIFLARVNAVLKRHNEKGRDKSTTQQRIVYGSLEIDPHSLTVKLDNIEIKMTLHEFRLLYYLAEHPSWIFSRQQLIDAVSGEDHYINERTIDVQISSLRKKLGSYGKYIGTVRGVGYRFEVKNKNS